MNPTTIKKGTREYKNLVAVAGMLTALSATGYEYRVEDVYFDFGQNWMWTTITRDSKWGGVQVLSPRDWNGVIFATSTAELAEAVDEIRNDKYFSD